MVNFLFRQSRILRLTPGVGLGLCLMLMPLSACFAQSAYPDASDLQAIQMAFRQHGLPHADVRIAPDGRVGLIGNYENRAEVQTAFSIAQQRVGVKWVAPTTPENVRYPIDNSAELLRQALKKFQPQPQPPAPETGGLPQRHALIVGVKEFQDKSIQQLAYTVRDAEAFRDFLVSPAGGNFPPRNVTLLTDRQATRNGIEQAMDSLAAKARPGDIVVVYFSTHGTPLNDHANMGIVAYDTQVRPRERIFFTSISDEKLSGFIRSMGNVNVMVVLDTCYSGMAYSRVPGFLATGAKDLFVEEDKQLVQGVPQKSLRYLGAGGKDLTVQEEQGLPPQSPVRILISASDGNQRSWESDALKNSVFTYHFIEGLKKRRNVVCAYDYAKPLVIEDVKQQKQQVQTPQAVFLPAQANINM